MARKETEVIAQPRFGSITVMHLRHPDGKETIEIHHELPAEPYDRAINVVGRSEVICRISTEVATQWTNDVEVRQSLSLALAWLAGQLALSPEPHTPQLPKA
jgi:hypothetical protein